MLWKGLITCTICFLLLSEAGGQNNTSLHCGTDQLDAFFRQNFPEYIQNRQELEINTLQVSNSVKSSFVLKIPVVVHVIYRLPEQNISNEQIQSQIDVLNKDYNKNNWDTMLVPSVWKSLIADCQIEFVLANRDPQGNPHSGITRTQTTIANIGVNGSDNHCLASKGGHDIWDRDSYLNIWVCELDNSLLGFAAFPGAPSYCDGVVISTYAFGTQGTAVDHNDKGRTTTHEVGHWLNLQHLWGNTTCGDDQVSDTPIQEKANFECPGFPHVTCNNGPNGDMFMNFMDWTYDECMQMFTNGQRDRMMTALNASRSSLFNSNGYTGIDQPHSGMDIRVQPNPAGDFIDIYLSAENKVKRVEIMDLNGKQIRDFGPSRTESPLHINTSGISSGMYILRVRTTDQTAVSKIIIREEG